MSCSLRLSFRGRKEATVCRWVGLPLAGGAGSSRRGTAGLFRSEREQARRREVASLEDVVEEEACGATFSAGILAALGSLLLGVPALSSAG